MKQLKSAHLKLTTWYVLIIMVISLFFSSLIYLVTVRELSRSYHMARLRLQAENLDISLPRHFPTNRENLPPGLQNPTEIPFLNEDLEASKANLKNRLILINLIILVSSTGLAYFLASKALEPLEKSLAEQKRFISDASHELKTPLTALKTSIEVDLKNKHLDKKTKTILKSNLQDINHLAKLINNLLDLSSANHYTFEKTNIKKLIIQVLTKIEPLAKAKKIKINTRLKNLTARVDQEKFGQVLTIILDNAIKYTPKAGQINISLKGIKNTLVLKIKDNGMGINRKDLPHIFERFYRADSSRTSAGFGLGLALAKKITHQHQGKIEVTSQSKKGTTFSIFLPITP